MPTKGGGGEGLVGGGTIQSGTQNCRRLPFLPYDKQVDQTLVSPPLGLTFSHYPHNGALLCSGVQAEWVRCATTILEEPTQTVIEKE